MISADWLVIAFVLGALTGHLCTQKASLASLYKAHLRGIQKGKAEQKELVAHLERKATRLESQFRKISFNSATLVKYELPKLP